MKPDRSKRVFAGWVIVSSGIHLLVLAGLSHFGVPETVKPVPEKVLMATVVTLSMERPAVTGRARRAVPEKKIKVRPVRPIMEVPPVTDGPGSTGTPQPALSLPDAAAVAGEADPSIRIPHDFLINGAGSEARRTSVGNETASEPEAIAFPPGWLSEVRNRIERAKRYPWSARLRGLEGTSLVRFRIAANGSVRDVAIRRSSAHKILDDAAVRTIERAAPFPTLPEDLARENIEINLPLVFELH